MSAVYLAEALGYYEDYGINAEYIEGESVVITVGTGEVPVGNRPYRNHACAGDKRCGYDIRSRSPHGLQIHLRIQ